ncbi:glycoside hydrolase family 113 [Aquimarina sp. 2201CG5-10]|uniref:glycoside hydrolase family 113 n=1 Tax=Aquimarina callyspongiae TaxID=3098150 RepID=UPI002AB56B33|nr:hypothetical protein [Aquimarina sp. 2201CG5-10]MDY8136129.1 hypothetical protein [Aquimarina sp. 2201CG5-10]
MKKELFTAFKVYVFSWLLIFTLMLSRAFSDQITIKRALSDFLESLTYSSFVIAIQVVFIIIYLLFLIIRYFIRVYHIKGNRIMIKRMSLYILLPVVVLISIYKIIVFKNSYEDYDYQWDYAIENTSGKVKNLYSKDQKHRGMSVFGWKNDNKDAIELLVKDHIEWVAVIPFLYQKDEQTVNITTPKNPGHWSRRDSVFIKNITEMRRKGIHIQLKPHLWMNTGWRSNINLNSKKDWDQWFISYRKNMMHYALMAEQTGVELLCVGTELKTSLQHQPDQWKSLIQEIKKVYSGKLTYAANWDGEFNDVSFWDEMDYIGIQAYFPISKKANPDLKTLKKGWDIHIKKLKDLSETHQKPILFTEVGYKSEASATIKPWEWGSYFSILHKKKSNKTQQLAYEALFQQLWDKDWFSGMYIWQWNINSEEENVYKSLGFSPRFKPAENIIAKWYGTVSF